MPKIFFTCRNWNEQQFVDERGKTLFTHGEIKLFDPDENFTMTGYNELNNSDYFSFTIRKYDYGNDRKNAIYLYDRKTNKTATLIDLTDGQTPELMYFE